MACRIDRKWWSALLDYVCVCVCVCQNTLLQLDTDMATVNCLCKLGVTQKIRTESETVHNITSPHPLYELKSGGCFVCQLVV